MASIAQEQNNPFVWNFHNELEIDEETGSELFNIFVRLDHFIQLIDATTTDLTPYDFWSAIDIRIPLDLDKYNKSISWATSGDGNAGNGNGWGVIHQKLSPQLYALVNANPNIMDWRATEAVCNHYLDYKGEVYPDNVNRNSDYLFKKYKESHNALVEKYSKFLKKVFSRNEFLSFLEGDDVELANIKTENPQTKETAIVRNVVRSFPNYWYDSNERPTPTYLYHYKKMNFLLKTIADCNYLAFDILLDKLDMKKQKHKILLVGSITLLDNNDFPAQDFPTGYKKSNIRSRFYQQQYSGPNLDNIDITKPFTLNYPSRYGDRTENFNALIPPESFTDENSPFNINNIDRYANEEIGYELRGTTYSKIIEDARRLFIDVAERSGIRQRHSNKYGYPNLHPDTRHGILDKKYWEKDKNGQPYKWKYDWLFQHSYAGEDGDGYNKPGKRSQAVGDIQSGLNKKYILTFILQHAYETNDRRLFENYRRFKHIYGQAYYHQGNPDASPTASPYFEAPYYGGGGGKPDFMDIQSFEFVNESLNQEATQQNSACERWLTEYNKKLIDVGQKFLEKCELPENFLAKTDWFKQGKKEIRDATKFFLASVDKKPLVKNHQGSFSTGYSNTTSSFMVEEQTPVWVSKRAWLWWKKNDITEKDRVENAAQAKLMGMSDDYIALLGKEGFSGFYTHVNLFGSPYNLDNVYYYKWERLGLMVSILTFKQTFNKIFEKEYKKQGKVQELLILDKAMSKVMNLKKEEEGTNLKEQDQAKKQQIDETEEQKEKKDKNKRTLSVVKKVLDNPNLTQNIASFGGKRRKKTKSKYNKRMTKRTRRKRGGAKITATSQLQPGTQYKITIPNNTPNQITTKFTQEDQTWAGKVFLFEDRTHIPLIFFGEIWNNVDAWIEGTEDNNSVISVPKPIGFFVHDDTNRYFDDGGLSNPSRKEITIESIEAGGRRRRRKRRTKRKNKKKRRKRRCTKKKRRKRR
jgi:hypothetical protein